MKPSYQTIAKTLLELQMHLGSLAYSTATRCIVATKNAQPLAGLGCLGALTLLARIDLALGTRHEELRWSGCPAACVHRTGMRHLRSATATVPT